MYLVSLDGGLEHTQISGGGGGSQRRLVGASGGAARVKGRDKGLHEGGSGSEDAGGSRGGVGQGEVCG